MNRRMFKDYSKVLIYLCFSAVSFSVLGQTETPSLSNPTEKESDKLRSTSTRPKIITERDYLAVDIARTQEQMKRLLPDKEYIEEFKIFLASPKTGLFRLLSDRACETSNLVRVNNKCESFIPGSSFYSFRKKNHTNQFLYDLRLKDGNLIADGFLSQGILVSLGDIPLEMISLESKGIKFLADFIPEVQSRKVLAQILEIVKGKKLNGYEYRKGLPAVANVTYGMRVVAYKGSNDRVSRTLNYDFIEGDRRFRQLLEDKRMDIIVAFRILKENNDGSLIILWKELKQDEAPILQN